MKNYTQVTKSHKECTTIKKISIETIKSIKTISEHSSYIFCLLLLKDKRIASCSADKTIRIFDPSNNYHCDQVIKKPNNAVYSICQLDNGTIVSCLDNVIKIGDFTINNAHVNFVYKVITLPNNRIASCSWHNSIKIWKSNPP